MKRPRSYAEDLEDDVGDKGVFKDWARRDPDPDRASSHRRFHSKASDTARKGSSSSSYDHRSVDDDRSPPPPISRRKRFDHDSEGFDRRKGGFDRYWEGSGDRQGKASSPRVGYGGDRIRRSESFSLSRREFPKGFRSERERSRREGSSGSSWRRSSSMKESADDEVRSTAAAALSATELVGRGSRVASEDRSKSRSKDSSSGEPARSVEVKKPVELRKESSGGGGGSEMEEGELEPDPVLETKTEPAPAQVTEQSEETETECRIGSEGSSENGGKSSSVEKLGLDEEDVSDSKDNELVLHKVEEAGDPRNHHRDFEDGLGERDREEVEVVVEAAVAEGGKTKIETEGEQRASVPSPGHEPEHPRNEQSVEEDGQHSSIAAASPVLKENDEKQKAEAGANLESETQVNQDERHRDTEAEQKEEMHLKLEVEQKAKGIDLEADPVGVVGLFSSSNEGAAEGNREEVTLELMTGKLTDNGKDKGKSLAVSLSNEAHSMDEEDDMEGPSSRGFELVFRSEAMWRDKASAGGIVIGKRKDEKLKLEPLDLSLGLPGVSSSRPFQDPNLKPNSPGRTMSIQSLPTSFRTNSDGFTASISMSGSQTFFHNPSCSLTQNSTENYEHSVGSRPIFQGIDQVSDGTVWQGQPSNELKRKGGIVPLYQRMLLNSNMSHDSSTAVDGQPHSKFSDMPHQSGLFRQFSSKQSHSSNAARSEHSKEKKVLSRERSSNSLFRSEQREVEQIVSNGAGVFEKILAKIVSDPVQLIGRAIQEMTEQFVSYLKGNIGDMLVNKDKFEELRRLQEALLRRSDLSLETLSKSHRVLLEILVAIKTGLPDFLRRENSIPSVDLAEIFLNQKCRNLGCGNILPVDECDCKVCSQKNGFCSTCMCLVCSKFDLASNTCSWVGCDYCLHWCHTDCALRHSHIKNGRSISGAQGTTEIQFHCVACGHPSEMFGFVKEVFKTCAKDWKAETLAKELEYVRRIFSASDDVRGKRLCDVADQLLLKLENKSNLIEVFNSIMGLLAESDVNSNNVTTSSPKEVLRKNAEGSTGMVGNGIVGESNRVVGSSSEAMWMPSVSTGKSPRLEISGGVIPSLDSDQLGRQTGTVKLQRSPGKNPVTDELDGVVKFKQAEAKMYQARADDARREAESLKRIAIAKNEKIDEEYAVRIAKLCLLEAEERRRQKLEQFHAIERAQREYLNMKVKMEADVKDLMLKMEATKRNLSA